MLKIYYQKLVQYKTVYNYLDYLKIYSIVNYEDEELWKIFEEYFLESNRSFGLEENDGHGAEPSHKEEDYSDSYDNHDNHDEVFHDDVDTSFSKLNRKTMAITKFEVMLHDLLLKHKASLLLYDEIIDLISIYITSPNFNRFDTLKSRKKLLRSTESLDLEVQ